MLNALDSLSEGGVIEVELCPLAPGKEGAEPSSSEVTEHDAMRMLHHFASRWFLIRIADNGPGFPPDLLPRAFEPFLSTKETGTGLGLSICQRIIEAHKGTIEVANRPTGGVEFTIRLPYVD